MRLTYAKRAEHCLNPLAKQLLQLMEQKRTNLALSADVTECNKLLDIADKIGPEICVLKTHVDILSDFTYEFTIQLRELAKKTSVF